MKCFLLLLFSGLTGSALAQHTDTELKKITEKNIHLLQQAQFEKTTPRVMIVNPLSNIVTLKQDHMPCVVPDIKAIVPMPNVLPDLTIPDVAAIPNPALPEDVQKSVSIQAPNSK
jgi:hypothetical protein